MNQAKRDKYQELWDTLVPDNHKVNEINNWIRKIIVNKARYESVGDEHRMPWEVIGCIHMRESSLNFTKHLANGDPLTADTIHVPGGIMAPLEPPYLWEETAVAAINHHAKGWNLDLSKYVWDTFGVLWYINSYHGFGCDSHGINDPYLWNYSNHYMRGSFDADGHFNPSLVDQNPGCATILTMMGY